MTAKKTFETIGEVIQDVIDIYHLLDEMTAR